MPPFSVTKSLKQYSLSPMYWIDRLIKRRGVKRVIQNSEICYVITEKQGIRSCVQCNKSEDCLDSTNKYCK